METSEKEPAGNLATHLTALYPLAPRGPLTGPRCHALSDVGILHPLEYGAHRRRWMRAFSHAPVPQAELLAVLKKAENTQRAPGALFTRGDTELRVAVAARRVEGLTAGLYIREGQNLVQLDTADAGGELAEDYADAPVLAMICAANPQMHENAYRELTVHVGALGYALWLAAISRGLSCSVLGRPRSGAAQAVRPLGLHARNLFTVALGQAAGGIR